MIKKANFNTLTEKAMQQAGRKHMRPVIEKELLHYDILFALDKEDLLDNLSFQGGTSLRLCYGSQRFSEDLDFAGGHHFSSNDLSAMKSCIEHYIGERYDFEVTVKQPKELRQEPNYDGLKVDKWQIAITTSPERNDLPKQRIKIEVLNVPAYSRLPQTLQHNYDFLPDGYSDIFILTESMDEVMTDKIISLVNCVRYIRYRDIWDLRWLKQQGAKYNQQWLVNKIKDYQITDYLDKLKVRIHQLPEIVQGKNFKNEMSRFIPHDVQQRTLLKDKFYPFLTHELTALLTEVQLFLSI